MVTINFVLKIIGYISLQFFSELFNIKNLIRDNVGLKLINC